MNEMAKLIVGICMVIVAWLVVCFWLAATVWMTGEFYRWLA